MNTELDFKLDYLTKLFEKISHKRIESYCIQRLYASINNPNLEIKLQQYVRRYNNTYALSDVAFPQVKIMVEINEPAHYKNEQKIQQDLARLEEISKNSDYSVHVIDCTKSLDSINSQIDELANEIKGFIQETDGFEPWDPEYVRSANYWLDNYKELSTTHGVQLATIDEVCTLFGVDPKKAKRGYLRKSGVPVILSHSHFDGVENFDLWWPSLHSRQGWINTINTYKTTISVSHTNPQKAIDNYQKYLDKVDIPPRVVFLYHKDMLGFVSYDFVGVFEFNEAESRITQQETWTKKSDMVPIH